MFLLDFNDNMNNALDEYKILMDRGWSTEDLNKIMGIFHEIKESNRITVQVTVRPYHSQ